MNLNEIVVFIKVAQLGSFTRAAESLELPKSTVSTKVSQLEKRLGVSLIHRTTRKINLTQVGQQFYNRCSENIQNLKAAEEEIMFLKDAPSGKIKISAPVFLGSYFLPNVVSEYRSAFPKVDVELVLTDRNVDLVAEGIDIAIRAGRLQDSSLISKKIGAAHFSLFASPTYLKKSSRISHPKDLREHQCLQFSPLGREKWVLTNPTTKQSLSVSLQGGFVVDDIATIKALTLHDQGIALLPTFSCAEETRAKDLAAVLPEWRTDLRPVHFVYHSGRFLQPKLKQFILLAEKIMRPGLNDPE